MNDPSIGGPGPSGSAAQTPTLGVPNTINQTPVGANTGHEAHAGSGPSGSKTACGGPDPTYIFNFGGSGPSGSNTGGPGPKYIFNFGGSGPSASNTGPGSDFNFGGSRPSGSNPAGPGPSGSNTGGPGPSNSNTRGRGRGNQNSGRSRQKRPADSDLFEEQEWFMRRPTDLVYDDPSANNTLNERLAQEIFFERRDQKGDILLHRNYQDMVNWYVPTLDKPDKVRAIQGLLGCDQESLSTFFVTLDAMVQAAKKMGSVIMKFDIEFETPAEHEDKKRHLEGREPSAELASSGSTDEQEALRLINRIFLECDQPGGAPVDSKVVRQQLLDLFLDRAHRENWLGYLQSNQFYGSWYCLDCVVSGEECEEYDDHSPIMVMVRIDKHGRQRSTFKAKVAPPQLLQLVLLFDPAK